MPFYKIIKEGCNVPENNIQSTQGNIQICAWFYLSKGDYRYDDFFYTDELKNKIQKPFMVMLQYFSHDTSWAIIEKRFDDLLVKMYELFSKDEPCIERSIVTKQPLKIAESKAKLTSVLNVVSDKISTKADAEKAMKEIKIDG